MYYFIIVIVSRVRLRSHEKRYYKTQLRANATEEQNERTKNKEQKTKSKNQRAQTEQKPKNTNQRTKPKLAHRCIHTKNSLSER